MSNILSEVHPELVAEWSDKNLPLTPDRITYIDAGVIPKYAGCVNGVQWFKDRGQWLDNSAEPRTEGNGWITAQSLRRV